MPVRLSRPGVHAPMAPASGVGEQSRRGAAKKKVNCLTGVAVSPSERPCVPASSARCFCPRGRGASPAWTRWSGGCSCGGSARTGQCCGGRTHGARGSRPTMRRSRVTLRKAMKPSIGPRAQPPPKRCVVGARRVGAGERSEERSSRRWRDSSSSEGPGAACRSRRQRRRINVYGTT